MTKREAIELNHQEDRLRALGISREDAEALRRISMTLRRWFELECGTGDGQVSVSVERDGDDGDGKPFKRIQYPTAQGYVDRRYPIADRETGARKRLATIMARYPGLTAYVQGDPRGCSLYILTAEQLRDTRVISDEDQANARPGSDRLDIDSVYTRGVAVA